MNCAPKPITGQQLFYQIHRQLMVVEREVLAEILTALRTTKPMRQRVACDTIFARFSQQYVRLCVAYGFASRAASFSTVHLIPRVLKLEQQLATEFHKGALFYTTALAHLLAGNEDGYERFLAMADEEDYRTSSGAHKRGTSNLRDVYVQEQTITKRMELACDLLNGKIARNAADFSFITGMAPVIADRFNSWRKRLDPLHQFELLRIIHDFELPLGVGYPNYPAVTDNPFIMLRLAKALSHLAQWVESCLTQWQGGGGEALGKKLKKDPDFGASLSKCAGSGDDFAGHSPKGSAVDTQLRQLLADLVAARVGAGRHWRLLRILYIVRNSTAHTIEPNLAMYQDRAFLLNLLQVVFVSVFVICQLKAKPMPLP
jgi:hypothetical protein